MSKPTTTRKRTEIILALHAAGMSQSAIAEKLQCSTKTVQRHLAEVQPSIEDAEEILQEYRDLFEELRPVKESAKNYVDLAINAKNEAVRLGAEQRIDTLRGVVPLIDRMRLKTQEESQHQPMFMLPCTQVSVTVNTGSTPQDVVKDDRIIDVTPEEDGK